MPDLNYPASEIQVVLDMGPEHEEDFFRIVVSGCVTSKHLNVSRDQLVAIRDILSADHADSVKLPGPQRAVLKVEDAAYRLGALALAGRAPDGETLEDLRAALIDAASDIRGMPGFRAAPASPTGASDWRADDTPEPDPAPDFPATPEGFAAAQAEADRMADEENARIVAERVVSGDFVTQLLTASPDEHAELAKLLADWFEGALARISEHGTSHEWPALIDDAKARHAALGIPWSNTFVPGYVREILAMDTDGDE